jgi:hypothetical protein
MTVPSREPGHDHVVTIMWVWAPPGTPPTTTITMLGKLSLLPWREAPSLPE